MMAIFTFDFSNITQSDVGPVGSFSIDLADVQPLFADGAFHSFWPGNLTGTTRVQGHFTYRYQNPSRPEDHFLYTYPVSNWSDTPAYLLPHDGYIYLQQEPRLGQNDYFLRFALSDAIPDYPKATQWVSDFSIVYTEVVDGGLVAGDGGTIFGPFPIEDVIAGGGNGFTGLTRYDETLGHSVFIFIPLAPVAGLYGQQINQWIAGIDSRSFSRFDLLTKDADGLPASVIPVSVELQIPEAAPTVGDLLHGTGQIGEARIIGSKFSDQIAGLSGAPNTFVSSAGNDRLTGGDKNDTFDYSNHDLSVGNSSPFPTFENDFLTGGGETNNVQDLNRGLDLLKLPGQPQSFRFHYDFNRDLNLPPAWKNTEIEIAGGPNLNVPTFRISSSNIEKVTFAEPISNVVSLTGGKMASEMLQLAAEVYGPLPSLEHTAEPLHYETSNFADVTATAYLFRNWHPVEALELGIKPADYGEFTSGSTRYGDYKDLRYSFTNGFYAAYEAGESFFGKDRPEANALVLTGIVDGKRSLAIVFRGTDQIADPLNFPNFRDHFRKFVPLVDAVKDYVKDSANAIQQVLVAGHSLGAGMAQYFMADIGPNTSQYVVRAYTDGSPGSDHVNKQTHDSGIVNFIHTDDLVTKIPDYTAIPTDPAAKLVLGVVAGFLSPRIGLIGAYEGVSPTAVNDFIFDAIVHGLRKFRVGSDVLINNGLSNSVGIPEHDKALYVQDVIRLQELATDMESPFNKQPIGAGLAEALRSGLPYSAPLDNQGRPITIQIAPGSSGIDIIRPDAGDDFSLGGGADDQFRFLPVYLQQFFLFTQLDTKVQHPHLVTTRPHRYIDGGTGTNHVMFVDLAPGDLVHNTFGDETFVRFQGQTVGLLTRIQFLLFIHDATSTVVPLNGFDPSKIQRPAPGEESAHVGALTAYFDASGMSVNVSGAHGNAVILVGAGSTVKGGPGHTTIAASEIAAAAGSAAAGPSAAAAEVAGSTLDGEQGDDIILGGSGPDIVLGGAGNDTLAGGAGADQLRGEAGDDILNIDSNDTVVDGGDGNDTVNLTGNGMVFNLAFRSIENANGTAGNDQIDGSVGTTGPLSLNGLGGEDALTGGGAADFIDGGDGSDIALFGGGDNDTIFGGAGVDFINAGDGDDAINGGDDNDTIFAEAGNDTVFGDGDNEFAFGGNGNDTMAGGTGTDYLAGDDNVTANTGITGQDTLAGGDDNDTLIGGYDSDTLTGENGDDALYGDFDDVNGGTNPGSADTLTGGAGNDFMFGGGGDDTVTGSDGNNTLIGGSGNDTLSGGTGSDSYYGQAGTDTFAFADSWGTDGVWDWTDGAELFDLTAVTGLTDFSQLSITNQSTGLLNYADVSFAGNHIFVVGMTAAQLTAADFLL
jgi:Ca2+-binding RTX toxin-like protein